MIALREEREREMGEREFALILSPIKTGEMNERPERGRKKTEQDRKDGGIRWGEEERN